MTIIAEMLDPASYAFSLFSVPPLITASATSSSCFSSSSSRGRSGATSSSTSTLQALRDALARLTTPHAKRQGQRSASEVMMLTLRGKVALVTGAGRGVGRAIALRLASEGVAVTLLARSEEPLRAVAAEIATAGGEALAMPTDVADAAALERAVAAAEMRFGGIDILVNNAGVSVTAPTDSFSLESWHRVLDTNLTGAFVCSRAVYPALKRRGGGNIVAISSGAGRQGYPRMAAYSASKFGLIGLMQVLAAEWGPDRIKVSTILPGSIVSDFGGRTAAERARDPTRKYISPDDVADAVCFLLTQPDRAWTQEMSLWPF